MSCLQIFCKNDNEYEYERDSFSYSYSLSMLTLSSIFRGTGPRAINAVDLIINILQSLQPYKLYMTELSFQPTPRVESDESNNFFDFN